MYSLKNAKKVKIKISKKIYLFFISKKRKIYKTEVEDLSKLFINKEKVNNILI